MNILTLTQNQTLKVAKQRNLQNLTINYEDRELLFSIKNKDKYLFDIKDEIKINSFVGVIELKTGLFLEILPNFENDFKLFEFREKFLNIVLLNFKSYNYLFSKLDLKKFPLSEALIYLFANSLSNELIKLNSAFYHNENLALSIFKASIYLLSQNIHLSYLTKYLLNELLNSLEEIPLINLELKSFEDENLKDSYFQPLLNQLKFIMGKYLNFANSNSNYFVIGFDINTLFREFITYLFNKNRIDFTSPQIPLFEDNFLQFDFLIKESENIDKVIEVAWEMDEKILKDIFIYMNLKDIESYLIVPKIFKKDSITFMNNKIISLIEIDFSLPFDKLIDIKFNFKKDEFIPSYISDFDTKRENLIEWFYQNGINIQISNLKNLQKLKLSKGINSIPNEFELLKLSSLEISNSNLAEIPQSVIDNLTSLNEFILMQNLNLIKLPNLIHLTNLHTLTICTNGANLIEIPNYIYNFLNLKELNLSQNSLTTLIFTKFMDKLEKLIVNDNTIESYALRCENLKVFDISNNNLTYIFELPSYLKELNLSNNKLKTLTQIVTNLTTLIKLDISGNDIRLLPNEIGNLTNLSELNISYNRLTELPKSIEKLTNLEYIYLSGNYFSKFPNEIIKLMMINRNLKVIIEKEEFKKSIPYYLAERVL